MEAIGVLIYASRKILLCRIFLKNLLRPSRVLRIARQTSTHLRCGFFMGFLLRMSPLGGMYPTSIGQQQKTHKKAIKVCKSCYLDKNFDIFLSLFYTIFIASRAPVTLPGPPRNMARGFWPPALSRPARSMAGRPAGTHACALVYLCMYR